MSVVKEYSGRKHVLRYTRLILASAAMALLIVACAYDQGIDKTKFAELNRIAQDMKAAITSGEPCNVPDTLEQRLDRELAAVRDRARSKKEQDLIVAYDHLLAICRDGLLLCQSRTQFTHFDFFPKDRIYVSQELDSIVERYELPVEKHVYKPTGQQMKSVAGDSIGVIWGSALTQIKIIEFAMSDR